MFCSTVVYLLCTFIFLNPFYLLLRFPLLFLYQYMCYLPPSFLHFYMRDLAFLHVCIFTCFRLCLQLCVPVTCFVPFYIFLFSQNQTCMSYFILPVVIIVSPCVPCTIILNRFLSFLFFYMVFTCVAYYLFLHLSLQSVLFLIFLYRFTCFTFVLPFTLFWLFHIIYIGLPSSSFFGFTFVPFLHLVSVDPVLHSTFCFHISIQL